MPRRNLPAQDAGLFGDAAGSLEIVLSLLLDAVALQSPGIGSAVVIELDSLLDRRLPTPGMQHRIQAIRDHLAVLVAAADRGSLPN